MNQVHVEKNGEHPVKEVSQEKFKKFITPLTDIFEQPENFKLTLQVPGVERENLSIKIENNILTIKGFAQESNENRNVILRESCAQNYFRKFTLSNSVDVENIGAELKNGILTLTLPKREEAKPRIININ